MSGHPDDRYDNRDDSSDDRRRGPGVIEHGRAAVRVPGLFLILNGLFGLVILAILSVPLVFDPDIMVRALKDVAAQQPAGQQKQDLEKQVEDLENKLNQNRQAFVLQNAVELGIGAALNLVAIIGGFSMRSLGTYWLSISGAIVSLIPCATGFCCTGIPFGIWALVALSRPEVKAAFAARRRGNPDDQYMR